MFSRSRSVKIRVCNFGFTSHLFLKIDKGQELRSVKSSCYGEWVVAGCVCKVKPLLDHEVKIIHVFVFSDENVT